MPLLLHEASHHSNCIRIWSLRSVTLRDSSSPLTVQAFFMPGHNMNEQHPTDEFDVLEHSLERVMWTEHKKLEQLLTGHALTLPKFLVLVSLIKRGGACPIGELADDLFQSSPTMTGIVDRLVNDKLVEREREQE